MQAEQECCPSFRFVELQFVENVLKCYVPTHAFTKYGPIQENSTKIIAIIQLLYRNTTSSLNTKTKLCCLLGGVAYLIKQSPTSCFSDRQVLLFVKAISVLQTRYPLTLGIMAQAALKFNILQACPQYVQNHIVPKPNPKSK